MIWAVLGLSVLAVVLALLLLAVWRSRPVVTGSPTPEEAKITAGAIVETQAIVTRSERQAEEIRNADRKTLFALARNRLFRLRK